MPPAEPAASTAAQPTPQTYTLAQRAWLNFVGKVRRGEQLDPTGQYVKDGTMLPADSENRRRPKLDAARDKYPFALRADGTVVPLSKDGAGGQTNSDEPPRDDTPLPCDPGEPCIPPGGYTPPTMPTVTGTFVSSEGLGGSGDIVDLKTLYDNDGLLGYTRLNADLNKGAGGSYIYYHFTRSSGSVVQGLEYSSNQFPNLSPADPVVAYDSKTKHWFYQSRPEPEPGFAPIWYPEFGTYNGNWKPTDLNQGAGGEYIYSYQSKTLSVGNGAAPFHEIDIISGNSSQIQPPAGWTKWPYDLNEGAGGDYIYFCFKR